VSFGYAVTGDFAGSAYVVFLVLGPSVHVKNSPVSKLQWNQPPLPPHLFRFDNLNVMFTAFIRSVL
jgi:hypothetical protein